MSTRAKVLIGIGAAVALLLASGIGLVLGMTLAGSPSASVTSVTSSSARGGFIAAPGAAAVAPSAGGAAPEVASKDGATTAPQQMIVRTASVALTVENLPRSLAALRALITAQNGQIDSLTYTAGNPSQPVPLGSASSAQPSGPKSAEVVIRVPADRLGRLTASVLALGTVTSQSSGQQNVTQQYVDMAARLANLKAEETRLRTFFARASRVSDMLAIESQLSRVQGEIESLQAQITYLKNQVAMATLTVDLSEPGAVISPSGSTWGFRTAVTAGIRAAVAVLNGAVFLLIASLPFIALGLLVWLVVWLLIRRSASRRAEREARAETDAAAPTSSDEG